MTHYNNIIAQVSTNIANDFVINRECNYSLLGGDFGKAAYLFYASRLGFCDISTAESALDRVIESVSTTRPMITYCNGLAGLNIGLELLKRDGFLDFPQETTSANKSILAYSLRKYLAKDLDFLHGAIGLGFYFLTQTHDIECYNLIREVIDFLENTAIKSPQGGLYWLYPNLQGEYVQNLSISHGIASMAIFIARASRIMKTPKEKDKCLSLLRGIGNYLMENLKDPNELGAFTPMLTSGAKSRLGWCYGDIGTSIALRAAGEILSESKFLEKSHEIARFTALSRRNLIDNYVFDACFCHGSAGILYFFRKCCQQYDEEIFRAAIKYWEDITISMAQSHDGQLRFGHFDYDAKRRVPSLNLIEGDAGVALALAGPSSFLDNCFLYEY